MAPSAADLEYFSWFGYSPFGICAFCGAPWTDVMYAYDGPHCAPASTQRGA